MIYRFVLLSEEDDFFKREIHINSDALFLDFHHAIVESVNYDKSELSTFYLCDEEWNRKLEISLFERETGSDEDCYTMDKTRLEDLLEEEQQQLFYVFDMLAERGFFIVLAEMIPGKSLKKPVMTLSEGDAPEQTSIPAIEEFTPSAARVGDEFGEDFMDEEVDVDDLDAEGYSSLDETGLNDLY